MDNTGYMPTSNSIDKGYP